MSQYFSYSPYYVSHSCFDWLFFSDCRKRINQPRPSRGVPQESDTSSIAVTTVKQSYCKNTGPIRASAPRTVILILSFSPFQCSGIALCVNPGFFREIETLYVCTWDTNSSWAHSARQLPHIIYFSMYLSVKVYIRWYDCWLFFKTKNKQILWQGYILIAVSSSPALLNDYSLSMSFFFLYALEQ